jgi:methionine sulfoxide reductase heme-binding subunit
MDGLTLTLTLTVNMAVEPVLVPSAGMLHVVAAATPSPTLWYVTRTMAVSSYIALTFSVVLGMVRSIARTSKEGISWVADELHQFVATLAGLLVVGHLVSLRLDPFLPFSWTNLLLPLDEPYRPTAVILGVFALYAMAVTLVSSWLRRRMPYAFWRSLHYLSFVAFVLVTLHGLQAGSDAQEPWMRGIYAFSAGAVGYLMLMRVYALRPRVSRQA